MTIKMVVPRSRTSVRYSRADAPASAVVDPELFADIARLSREAGEWLAKYEKDKQADVKLAAAPAIPAGVSGAVVDAVTESRISSILGVDLVAAVRRLYPSLTLSAWVSRNFGSIEALQRALLKHKAAGSPVALSLDAMDAKTANATIIELQQRR